ncbi:peptidoglycan DD-metalloendopeptidase family protein [Ruminococcaceae bacterium OttesenSCG-928-D13]|nr:peptidoglycan DD-metalloendopeptidase family protein [Ruminococcaceae bacterium OttesenSCG-928-D13]
MKKTLKKAISICFVLALVLQCFTLSAGASGRTISEVQKEINEKQRQINELAGEIEKNKNNSAIAQDLLAQYQTAYDEVCVLIDEQEVLIARTADDLDEKTEELNATMQSITDNKQLYTERLRAIYTMNTTNTALQMLFAVESYSDVVSLGAGLQRISKRDTELLEQLANDKASFEAQKLELEEIIERLSEEMATLQAQRAENENMMQEMKNRIASANYQISLIQKEKDETEEEKAALVAELNAIFQASQNNGSKEGDDSVRHDGPLMWPTSGSIPSGGYFGDPRSNTGWHYGIDIRAPGGQAIVAAAGGTVITSTWHYSYGYYIIIDHGQGLRTLYAHCSELYASAGSYVAMGETIAAVGTTGDSTGNHLHFEVHEFGSRQNPLNSGYLNP